MFAALGGKHPDARRTAALVSRAVERALGKAPRCDVVAHRDRRAGRPWNGLPEYYSTELQPLYAVHVTGIGSVWPIELRVCVARHARGPRISAVDYAAVAPTPPPCEVGIVFKSLHGYRFAAADDVLATAWNRDAPLVRALNRAVRSGYRGVQYCVAIAPDFRATPSGAIHLRTTLRNRTRLLHDLGVRRASALFDEVARALEARTHSRTKP